MYFKNRITLSWYNLKAKFISFTLNSGNAKCVTAKWEDEKFISNESAIKECKNCNLQMYAIWYS